MTFEPTPTMIEQDPPENKNFKKPIDPVEELAAWLYDYEPIDYESTEQAAKQLWGKTKLLVLAHLQNNPDDARVFAEGFMDKVTTWAQDEQPARGGLRVTMDFDAVPDLFRLPEAQS